ncbi:ABC transporter ATP-binding protein [Pelagibacterium lacus]|uniref:ABC transporter ATP-binding protein n=1 Tax=Pelagibacterium lacus TaxID=2282655 RepID=A0A369W5Y9_9HYPH|nr:ABC transporter ATP-binding protein [Pelagibacterium lacus]RDE08770.1 ABC transporter ATP-binding protein [Pelagibacterium lacus]
MSILTAGRRRSRGDARAHVAAAHAGKGSSPLLRITFLSLRHPVQVTIAVAATMIAALLQLLIPRLLGQAIDQAENIVSVASDTAHNGLWATALTLLAVSVARGVFTLFQNYFAESVGHHVGYELRLAFYDKVQRLSYSYHDKVHSGDLITVGLLDLDGIRMFFSTGLIRVVLLTVLIGVGAWMLLSTDVLLGLLALSFVPFVAWRSSVARLGLRKIWLDLQEKLSVLTRIMEENLGGIRVVRAFSGQKHELDKFDAASAEALRLAHRRTNTRVRNTSMMTFSFFAAMGLVLWFGGNKVIAGEISVGTLASFLTFMTILQMPVRQLGLMVNSFARASTCGNRFFAFIDAPVEIEDRPGARELVITEGTLEFDGVGFTYDGASQPTLRDISFTARAGETIGIVGAPGSGKSTLAHLIPRFYDATTGSVRIDGQDVRDVTLQSLRSKVAVVQQDTFLFTTSIENNIAYGNPWAKETRIEKAAESAQLHNYIMGLPAEYDTVVGERGVSLSGGQRQRLSIARSLVLKPAVMVFDDSTAAIDAGTEHRIRSAIRRYAANRVTIIISHRLSSLLHADRILFIEDGAIIEQGTHADLLALGGRYKALHDLQTRPVEDIDALEARP